MSFTIDSSLVRLTNTKGQIGVDRDKNCCGNIETTRSAAYSSAVLISFRDIDSVDCIKRMFSCWRDGGTRYRNYKVGEVHKLMYIHPSGENVLIEGDKALRFHENLIASG